MTTPPCVGRKSWYIIILLLLKPTSQAQVGKTKFIDFFHNPTSTCATEKWRKHNSGKQQSVDCTLEPIQRFTCYPHTCHLKLQWMSCDRSSRMSNSGTSRWKLTEETVIRVRINLVQHTKVQPHDIDDTTTRNSDRDKAWPPNTPHLQEAEGGLSSWPPHQRTILKDWKNKCKIAMK